MKSYIKISKWLDHYSFTRIEFNNPIEDRCQITIFNNNDKMYYSQVCECSIKNLEETLIRVELDFKEWVERNIESSKGSLELKLRKLGYEEDE